MDDEIEFLYHVTFYSALPSIAQRGLQAGRGGGIGGAAYGAHRAGSIFLTEGAGVAFWTERAEQWAEDRSDDLEGDGLAPVLLRIATASIDKDRCVEDQLGTRDARHDAFKCSFSIPAKDIEVWAGANGEGEWVDVEDYGEIPVGEAFETDSDDDSEWTYFASASGGPSVLVPDVSDE
jgi:hypothetical protein